MLWFVVVSLLRALTASLVVTSFIIQQRSPEITFLASLIGEGSITDVGIAC